MPRQIEPVMGKTHESVIDTIMRDCQSVIEQLHKRHRLPLEEELPSMDDRNLVSNMAYQKYVATYLRNALLASDVCLTDGSAIIVKENLGEIGQLITSDTVDSHVPGAEAINSIRSANIKILRAITLNLIQGSPLTCENCLTPPSECSDRDPFIPVEQVIARVKKPNV